MLCLSSASDDPCFNLAVEERLLKETGNEYLLLYINSPSVIIGKHQVAHREVDTRYVEENNIPVVRRISGGGAVYHDTGNLNFTFIIRSTHGKQVDFAKYTKPVIEFLSSSGINASLEGKSDIKVDGYKISGNAEHVWHESVLHHGTLLFNTDLSRLKASLRKDPSHYSTRAVASNPARVMNLSNSFTRMKNIADLRAGMLEYFCRQEGNSVFTLPESTIAECKALAESKFRTWEWNYAYGPEYHFNNRFSINGVPHSCSLFVKDGIIHECRIEGSDQVASVSKRLIGCRHMVKDMQELFMNENILIKKEDILKFF